MMPGENHFKALAIAVDATAGNCQNCSVLQQSLGEYVSSLLALKREITVSDDTIRLQHELEELQLQLVTLQRKMADYESVQAELQEKKSALKVYGQLYEEMEKLKEENSGTVAENKKLEDQIKNVKDLSEKQSLENAQLRREKAVVEDDLLKSQASLQRSQAQAEQVEKLTEENAQLTSTNDSLKRKVQTLEDSVCQQMHQISQLTKEKSLLERNIHDVQVRLMKLERQNNKEYRSTTTQASAPAEAKIDKEKFQRLLESLWACVEPEQSVNQLHFPESSVPPSSSQTTPCPHPSKMSPFDSQNSSESPSLCKPAKTAYTQLKLSPRAQGAIKHKASNKCLSERKQTGTPKKSKRSPKSSKSSTDMDMLTLEEIMTLFKPMPPSISPIPDLDTEMESIKMDDGENETHHKPSDDARTLKKEQPLGITTSSSSQKNPKSSSLQTEENADLPVVTIQGEISNEKDSATKPGSFNGEMNGKIITDMREMHPQTNRQIEQEPSSAQLSPSSLSSFSSSSFTGLMEAVSLPTKCPPLSCSLCGISETQNALGNTKGDHLHTVACKEDEAETITSMDVDRTVTPEGSESPRVSDCVEGTVVVTAENGSETEKNTQDSFKPHESTESHCKDSDISESISVFNGNLEEKRETDESIKVLETEDRIAQGTQEDDATALPALSNCDNIPQPLKSPLLKKEDGLSSNVHECGQANVEPPSKKDGGVNTASSSQETDAINCESLTSKSLYTQASPSCLSPSMKLQTLGTKPNPGKLDLSTNKDLISTEKVTVYPNLQDEGNIEKATVEDLAQHKIQTGSNMPLETVPAAPETNAANCKSSKENKQLAPSRLSSTIKLQSLETQPNPEISDADVHTENISTNIQTPSFMLEEQSVTRTAILEGLPESKVDGGGVTPLIQSPAATERQDKCLKLHTKVPENLIREEKTTSGESSSVAQECISDVRSKMGPPLPRLLTPLKTPPKANSSINPRQAIGKLLFPSPMDGVDSPSSPVRASRTPSNHQLSSLSTNSPNRVPSSPLQFGSATPKHAVPVPGRLPLTAMSSPSSTTPSQENSMRILDTMYPELSARARTLSILRGNVNLSICSSESRTLPTTDSQKSSFKTINSTATAFTKTEMRGEKRPAVSMPQPKNKCLKLESSSAGKQVPSNSGDDSRSAHTPRLEQHKTPKTTLSPMISVENPEQNLILNSLRKIESQCVDLLPVIQSHVNVGNLPKKPVLRDEEKEVISEVCQSSSADDVILAILNTLKAGKLELSRNYMQALCRVYTAICRQRREVEKVRVLAYSLLVEDFPDSATLVLFVMTTWPTVLTHTSSLCQAIHAVTKLKTPEKLLSYLSAFLGWDKSPPCDIDELISRTLSEVRSGSDLSFIKHSRYGEDLGTRAWEHVYALHLLCTNKNWKWTYDNLLGKELWPVMNSWIAQPRQRQEPISDVAAATVLRLIGRIGQMGLKKKCVSTVVTIANVINSFGRHGPAEGVPWEVQLAAIYCIHDLSPCNPKQALEALAGWRGETSQSVPPAVTSCMNQLASVCRQVNS